MLSLSQDFNWVKTHLLLLAIVGGLIFAGVYGVEALVAKHDEKNSQALAQLADNFNKQNQILQQQNAAQIKALTDQNIALQSEIATLATSLAKRQTTETQLPVKNANLSAIDAAKALGGTADGDNVVLDLPISRQIVTQVQLVPLLQADKADLEKQNGLLQTEVANGVKALDLERASHGSDNTAKDATIKSLQSDLSTAKAECRKSKLKWFGIGFVAGYITGKIF